MSIEMTPERAERIRLNRRYRLPDKAYLPKCLWEARQKVEVGLVKLADAEIERFRTRDRIAANARKYDSKLAEAANKDGDLSKVRRAGGHGLDIVKATHSEKVISGDLDHRWDEFVAELQDHRDELLAHLVALDLTSSSEATAWLRTYAEARGRVDRLKAAIAWLGPASRLGASGEDGVVRAREDQWVIERGALARNAAALLTEAQFDAQARVRRGVATTLDGVVLAKSPRRLVEFDQGDGDNKPAD